ncbi:hypothetical protein FQR65_LT08328 [Abscondita terminalis]|nr:hypothetical protein FQR65_LT08328 [Abscondita terminalis]
MLYRALLITLLLAVSHADILDDFLSSCFNQGLTKNTCITNLANNLRPFVTQAITEFGLPSFEPLVIKRLNVTHKSPVSEFIAELDDLSLYNIITFEIINVDFGKNQIMTEAKFPYINMTTRYKLDGTLLGKPAKGNGFAEFQFYSVYGKHTITYSTNMKNDVKHCVIEDVKVDMVIEDTLLNLSGLDENSVTNEDLNSNSKLISQSMSHALSIVFAEYMKKQLSMINFLKKVSKMFPYLVICLVTSVAASDRLEEYLSECKRQGIKRNFCMQSFANSVRANQGVEEFGLPPLDPFEIPKINISQDGEDMSFSAQMYNFALHNFANYQVLSWKQKNGKVVIEIFIPNVTLTTFYEIDGTMFRQLFKGRGFGQMVFIPVYAKTVFFYDTFWESGVKYCKILKVEVEMTIGECVVHLEGLHKDSIQSEFLNLHSELVALRASKAIGRLFEIYWQREFNKLCRNDPSYITKTLFV